jgi:diguanylate cyclase (GGDEF)-like protein/PAS domain S-box-containing protein
MLLVSVTCGLLILRRGQEAVHASARRHARAIGLAAAAAASNDRSADQPIARLIATNPDIVSLRTFVLNGDAISTSAEFTRNGKSEFVSQGNGQIPPSLWRAISKSEVDVVCDAATSEPGCYLTAYAPVTDHSGRRIGAVCVVIRGDSLWGDLRMMRGAFWGGVLVAAAVSGLMSLAYWSAAATADKRAQLLREQARMLETVNSELCSRQQDSELNYQIMEAANQRFTDLYMALPVACFTFDTTLCVREWNDAAAVLFGKSAYSVIDKPILNLFTSPEAKGRIQHAMQQVLAGQRIHNLELAGHFNDNTLRYVVCNLFPLKRLEGEIPGGICVSMDITSRKEYENHLCELAATDGLTGLMNQRTFKATLQECFNRAQRAQREDLSLILLDIDHFKAVNDVYGHSVGDAVLKAVADAVRSAVRENTFVARYGGEELAVLCPRTPLSDAVSLAERLRCQISNIESPAGTLSASFGVAGLAAEMSSPHDLFAAADEMLYAAKSGGRNKVCATPRPSDIAA